MRRDLGLLRPGDELATDLRILTTRRTDLVGDRTRQLNRLRAQLLEIFPALEHALDLTNRGPVVLLQRYQTPAQIRRAGTTRIQAHLRSRKVKGAAALAQAAVAAAQAQAAVAAAQAQQLVLPGETLAAAMVARLAKGVMALDAELAELAELDELIEARFRRHRHAEVLVSLPGMGPILGAEFLAATGGDLTLFGNADRLASFAGLAPVPRDSGRVRGNLHRPRRFNRRLLRVFYLSSLASLKACPASRAYYDRKRAEGKSHKQALLALSRRRVNVLWALLRDEVPYQATPVTAAA